jgi:hypothetical protein
VKDVELLMPKSPALKDIEGSSWTPKAQQYLSSQDKFSKPPKTLTKLRNAALLPELQTTTFDNNDKQSSKRGSLRQSVKDAASRILSQGYRTPSHTK